MARIYYQNEEGDIVPEGYNFLLALTNIAKKAFEDDERLLRKLEDADSNQVIGKLIKEKGYILCSNKEFHLSRQRHNKYQYIY